MARRGRGLVVAGILVIVVPFALAAAVLAEDQATAGQSLAAGIFGGLLLGVAFVVTLPLGLVLLGIGLWRSRRRRR